MHLRKQRRIRREKLKPMRLCEDDGLPILDPADPTPSPEERTSGEEIAELVDRRLARLGEGYRRVFWLRFRDGYTESEIAEILGLNLTTVKTRAFRARVRLRQQLSDCLLAAA
jgi:RNA polymerase sigma-70 factor (ECF subfamily)